MDILLGVRSNNNKYIAEWGWCACVNAEPSSKSAIKTSALAVEQSKGLRASNES